MAATKSIRARRVRHPASNQQSVLDQIFAVRDGVLGVVDHMDAIQALLGGLPEADTQAARRRIAKEIRRRLSARRPGSEAAELSPLRAGFLRSEFTHCNRT